MTTPRIDAQYQGPQIRERGMVREHLMPADAQNACATEYGRGIFDLMFDVRYAEKAAGEQSRKRRRAVYRAAKDICDSCLVREACLAVHGADLELGMVGGLTDNQRKRLAEDGAA